jgi:hypothetical protein
MSLTYVATHNIPTGWDVSLNKAYDTSLNCRPQARRNSMMADTNEGDTSQEPTKSQKSLLNPNTHVLFASGMLVALFVTLLLSLRFSHDPEIDFPNCQAAIQNGSAIADRLITYDGTVDRYGNLVSTVDKIEGVRFPECEIMCGTGWQRENWDDIFNSLSGWLLPWLALTAQLPFQTRDKLRDLGSVFLVIGSPILAMYSLLLTFYNADWVRKNCGKLGGEDGKNLDHMNYVAEVLLSCQHVPLELAKDEEKLDRSTKVTQDVEEDWWANLAEMLRDTGRHATAALWAQLLLAMISYVFTLIVAFGKIGGKLH